MSFADYTSRIDPQQLIAADVVGVCRYLSHDLPSSRYKIIRQDEYDELIAHNIHVVLNWEYAADDWLGGDASGHQHATVAVAQAKGLGHPKGGFIVGSCDFDISATQWQHSGAFYARAFDAVVRAAGYEPGVYGPWDALEWCRNSGFMNGFFWQAGMSVKWSEKRNKAVWPHATLRQYTNGTIGGHPVDLNEILDWALIMSAGDADKAFSAKYTGVEPWVSGVGWMAQAVETPLRHVNEKVDALTAKVDALTAKVTAMTTLPQDQVTAAVTAWLDAHVHLS